MGRVLGGVSVGRCCSVALLFAALAGASDAPRPFQTYVPRSGYAASGRRGLSVYTFFRRSCEEECPVCLDFDGVLEREDCRWITRANTECAAAGFEHQGGCERVKGEGVPRVACSQCEAGRSFLSGTCSRNGDAVCSACTVCGASEYEVRECAPTVDRICGECADYDRSVCWPQGKRLAGCGSGELGACADTSAQDAQQLRAAGECAVACSAGEWLESCSEEGIPDCKPCAACRYGGFRQNCSSAEGPGVCVSCAACDQPGMYREGCEGAQAGVCRQCEASRCSGAHEFLHGCGGVSAGVCLECSHVQCPVGYKLEGCGGVSAGACTPCSSLSCPEGFEMGEHCECLPICLEGTQRSPGATSMEGCVCLPGYYTPTEYNYVCDPCPPNHVKKLPGPGQCTECPENSRPDARRAVCICNPGFSRDETSGLCTPCSGNMIQSGAFDYDTPCRQCAGKGALANSARTECFCPAGSYGGEPLDECLPCTAEGEYTSTWNAQDACSTCPLGMLANDAHSACTCASDYHRSGESACAPCPANSKQDSTSPDFCACNPGFGWDGEACVACAPGHAKPLAGNHACEPCPASWFSNAVNGSSACVRCPLGSTTSPGQPAALPQSCLCAPGHVGDPAEGACTPCELGFTKAALGGGGACLECPPGTSTVAPGAASRSECVCRVGHEGAAGGEACSACTSGFYKTTAGVGNCSRCPEGSVSEPGGSAFSHCDAEGARLPCPFANTVDENCTVFSRWRHVRHLPATATAWFSARDNLRGTYVTGSPDDPESEWSVAFAHENFTHYLFMSGDTRKWIVAERGEVNGEFYDYQLRNIERSSTHPGGAYKARWFNLEFTASHPMVALEDVSISTSENGLVLYLEAGDDLPRNVAPIAGMGGVDVFIRDQGNNGCCKSTLGCDRESEQATPDWSECECRPGYEQYDAGGAPACRPCAVGHFKALPGNSTACEACPRDHYSAVGSATCTACPTGSTAGAGAGAITDCALPAGLPCVSADGRLDVGRRDTCASFAGWEQKRFLPAASAAWFTAVDALLGLDHRASDRADLDGLVAGPDGGREVAAEYDGASEMNVMLADSDYHMWAAAPVAVLRAEGADGDDARLQRLARSSGAPSGLGVGRHLSVTGREDASLGLRVWQNTSVHFNISSSDCPLRLRLRDVPAVEYINEANFHNFNRLTEVQWNYMSLAADDCTVIHYFQIDLKAVYTVYSVYYVMYWDFRNYCSQRVQLSETGEFAGEEVEVFRCDEYNECDDSTQMGRTVMVRARRARFIRIGSSRSDSDKDVHFTSVDVFFTPCHALASYLVQRYEGALSLYYRQDYGFPFVVSQNDYTGVTRTFFERYDDDRNRNNYAVSTNCEDVQVRYVTIDLQALYYIEAVLYVMYNSDGRTHCRERVQVSDTGEFAGEHRNYYWCSGWCGNAGWHGRKVWAPGRNSGDPRGGNDGLAPARYVRIGVGKSDRDNYARINNIRLDARPYLGLPKQVVAPERILHMQASSDFSHSGEVCDFGRWGPQLNQLYSVWCADRNVQGEEWIAVHTAGRLDPAKEKIIGVVTQGRFDSAQWVTSFGVELAPSPDGPWRTVQSRYGWETDYGYYPGATTEHGFRWVLVADTPRNKNHERGSWVGLDIFNDIFRNSGYDGHTAIVWRECYKVSPSALCIGLLLQCFPAVSCV